MIWTNLLVHFGDWIKRNRASLIKWLVILAIAFIVVMLAATQFDIWQRSRYEKKIESLDRRIEQKDLEIKRSEAFINALKVEIAAKDALLAELDKQAGAAQKVVERTRTEYVYLKGEYEKTRDNPDVPIDISQCGACAELARAGHACK